MTLRLNFKAAILMAVAHFLASLGVCEEVASKHTGLWQWLAYVFVYPLRLILIRFFDWFGSFLSVHAGHILIILALAINSVCWGLLLSLIFSSAKQDAYD